MLTLLHAVLTTVALPLAYSFSAARFHTGLAPTLVEKALNFSMLVLYFPLVHLAHQLPRGWFPGLYGYLPVFLNSAFCAFVLLRFYVWLRPSSPAKIQ